MKPASGAADAVAKLTSIHDCVVEAIRTKELSQKAEGPTIPTSFRLRLETRQAAVEILEAHGTDLSAYLRACVLGLVRDYVPHPELVEPSESESPLPEAADV